MKAVPLIKCNAARAEQAWEVHKALVEAEMRNPALRDNPVWKLHRMDAYELFVNAFEVEQ